jgi:hypothetical protein
MTLRRYWVICCLACMGCQTFFFPDSERQGEKSTGAGQMGETLSSPNPNLAPAAEKRSDASLERRVQTKGSLETTRSHLSLAAAFLETGDEVSASQELAKYLTDHSEHFEVRLRLAELWLRQGKLAAAREEFTCIIAQSQELGDQTADLRLHCHGALMDIAVALDDDYNLHLQRGLGLYLVALKRAKLPDPHGQLPLEGLLCRAAGELALARDCRPEEAQPCWYLHLVWSALGQEGPARRWLERAKAAAPFTSLTPSEQRGLQWALRAADMRNQRLLQK